MFEIELVKAKNTLKMNLKAKLLKEQVKVFLLFSHKNL